jgi:hypothetical protein
MTDWQEKLTGLAAAITAYINPAWSFTGPKKETLQRWDALNNQRKVLGFGEIDNHNTRKRLWNFDFRIFPFDVAFSTIRTHVILTEPLSNDAQTAIRQVHTALQALHVYVAQEHWQSAKGFMFRIYNEARTAICGDDFVLDNRHTIAEIQLPVKGMIRLLLNGSVIKTTESRNMIFEITQPGVYRVEVLQKKWGCHKPWIYSNPIYVK